MSKRNPKRSLLRKEQSERDKMTHLSELSYYGQISAFQHLLGMLQRQGMHGKFVKIPMELIDLAAAFLASLVSGHEFLLAIPPHIAALGDAFRANVNFIRKTLTRAEISWSSLILCLWYIDQFFRRNPRRRIRQNTHPAHSNCQCTHKSHGTRGHTLENTTPSATRSRPSCTWDPRDLFMASIVVADKYLADVTWLNADWAECTGYAYSCQDINRLERQFLRDMQYKLHVTESDYHHFCNFLEFRLHLRQVTGQGASVLALSYRNIHVLSQSLPPVYVERLHLSLRPLEALYLLTKTLTSICLVYAVTAMTICALYQHAAWLEAQLISAVLSSPLLHRQVLERIVMVSVELARMGGPPLAARLLPQPHTF